MAELHLDTARWLHSKLHFATKDQIYWRCCPVHGIGLPTAHGERPWCPQSTQLPADRVGWYRCTASVLLPQDIRDAIWSVFLLGGVESAALIFSRLCWNEMTLQWEVQSAQIS